MKATGVPPLGTESKIAVIQELVARMFSLPAKELNSTYRGRSAALPRQIAMYLAKRETDASLMEIGSLFGGRHHTTVLHAISRIEEMRRSDSAMDLALKMLGKNLNWERET